MNKLQAKYTLKTLYGETLTLTPSALITLFEIDIGNLLFSKGVIGIIDDNNENQRIFRFHNNLTNLSTSIWWQDKQFSAAPIVAEGFEYNGRGTLPTPRLSISVHDDGIPALGQLKAQLSVIGDIAGAKVTRIRTLAKFLDEKNFLHGSNPDRDANAEFPRDVYYIDRKSNENKNSIEYELASLLDIEGVQLPGRMIIANRCPFTYRGEGCLYETVSDDGEIPEALGDNPTLLRIAPPVMTENDEPINQIISQTLEPRGKWNPTDTFNQGWYVYIQKDGIKYYFVAKITSQNRPPPNPTYWIADQCSKSIVGCKARWGAGSSGADGLTFRGALPFGGFLATNKFRS